ncbi:hypothetical protein SO694_00107015 [Aureococcus anophagefferens]|uniref:Uncharacterized protein n=1 Tax=Aureococcus anophagefferens TaxID=44056 RepID=A0ABR1FMJ3_AURAN
MATPFGELEGAAKEEMIVALGALVLNECKAEDAEEADFSAEKFDAVIKASGNSVAPYWTAVFSKAMALKKSTDDFCGARAPGGGGAARRRRRRRRAAAAAVEEKKEEEEEEEIDMGGGMDMFGGEEGGGDDY